MWDLPHYRWIESADLEMDLLKLKLVFDLELFDYEQTDFFTFDFEKN